MLPVIAEVVRSDFVEGHHYGSVVALDADHGVVFERGDTATTVLPRSCNKPLQAVGMLRAGLGLDEELLALACASHSGEDFHLAGVRRILRRRRTGRVRAAEPAGLAARRRGPRRLIRAGGDPKPPIQMNCSGKHAAMLATCVANDWPTGPTSRRTTRCSRRSRRPSPSLTGEPVGTSPWTAAAPRCS